MNELIEKLIYEFETACHLSFDCIEEEKFRQAIQTACKAQRNACLRESDKFKTSLDIKIRDSERESIKNAEIRKEDYE